MVERKERKFSFVLIVHEGAGMALPSVICIVDNYRRID